ncbi:MAG: ATP synthase F1 subunit epsilon, partial [Patescibacteria group bacterium]
MKNFHLTITTLERIVFDYDVASVTMPGDAGELTILPDHMPLITALKLGEITARRNGENFYMAISSGMTEVQPNKVLILADQAERAEEIDEKLAEEARARAEKIMQEKRGDEQAFAQAAAELERALLRLKIVRKHRSRSQD